MNFVPRHLAKTPKYDIYEHQEEEDEGSLAAPHLAAAGVHGQVSILSRGTDGRSSSSSMGRPIYSTPLTTALPAPLARLASTISPSPSSPSSFSSSSSSSSYIGRRGRGGFFFRGTGGLSHQYSHSSPCSTPVMPPSTPVCSPSTLSTPVFPVSTPSTPIMPSTPLSTPLTGPSIPVSTPVMSFSTKLSTSEGSGQLSTPPPSLRPRTPRTARSTKVSTSEGSRQLRTPPPGLLPRTPSTALSQVSTSSRTPGSARGSSRRTPSSTRSSRTPGSACSSTRTPMSATQQLPPSTIVAVVEGRGQAQGEVGLAAVDLRRPHLTLAQFSDTHTYTHTLTKLGLLNPLEVVVATTAARSEGEVAGGGAGRGGRGLLRVVQECLTDVSVTAVHRRYFNDARGLATIKHLAAPHCAYVERQVANRYYSLAAAAAVMKYVELVQHVTYASHSLHVELTSSEDTMNLGTSSDFWSWRALEVVRSLQGDWQDSLFGALRHTRTPAGTRKLRATLLQPFCNPVTINARLDSLEYLAQNPDLFHTLQSILGRFPDIDWLLSMCVQMPKEDTEQRSEQRLNYVIGLKNTLELLEPLGLALLEVTDPFLASIKETVAREELRELLEVLRGVLHEDARLVKGAAAMRTLRCYAIRSGVNGLLDVARKIYSEIIDDITESVAAAGKQYGLQVRVGHNAALGFHIIIPVTKRTKPPTLPPAFIKVQRGRGCLSCTTELVYQLDQRARDIVREILVMSNVIVQEVLGEARSKIGVLHDLGEAVATLDLLVALAHVAALGSWVRPEFSQTLAIRGGRHPILDLLSPTPPVPNNSFLGPGSLLMVVTGPNMSGKSTYLRQIALIQVLAQIGSFVPAEMASLRPVTKMFTHLGSEDRPEGNESTFQVQMNEVAHMMVGTEEILLGGRRRGGGGGGGSGTGSRGGAGPDSLVVLDELGSGTTLEEGGALAWAVVEALTRLGATTVLVTHTLFLTRLAALYPNVNNYHLESLEGEGGRLQLTHVVRKGVTRTTHYGLSLASVTPLPPSVLERARHLAHAMAPPTKVSVTDNNEEEEVEETRHAVYRLAHRLMALASTLPTPPTTPATPKCLTSTDTPMETSHIASPQSPRLIGHGVTSLDAADVPSRSMSLESLSSSQGGSVDPMLACESFPTNANNANAAQLMPLTGGFSPALAPDSIPVNASAAHLVPPKSRLPTSLPPTANIMSGSGINATSWSLSGLENITSGSVINASGFLNRLENISTTQQFVPASENITPVSHSLPRSENITAASSINTTSSSLSGPENVTTTTHFLSSREGSSTTSQYLPRQENITATSHCLQGKENITSASTISTSQVVSTPSISSTNLRSNTSLQEELSATGVGGGARAGGQGTEELRAQLETLRRDFLAKVTRPDLQRVTAGQGETGAPRLC